MPKSFDLNLLTALDALLHTGSVSAAASRMNLSTPAMSHTLARIRVVFEDPILVRAGRKLVPTTRALEMREQVGKLVACAHDLTRPKDALAWTRSSREFVIRAPDGVAIVHGAVLLAGLRARMPAATLRFLPESDADPTALREGRIDVDVGAVVDTSSEMLSSLLFEQPIVGVAKKGHPLFDSKLTAHRFATHQHVATTHRRAGAETIDRALAAAGLARRIALAVPSSFGALIAASRSSLVACVPEPLARSLAPAFGLKLFGLPVAVPDEKIVQLWHPRMDADPAHMWLRECIEVVSKPVDAAVSARRSRHRLLVGLIDSSR